MQELGFNYRMTEMSAARGKSIKRLSSFIARRSKAATLYQKLLANIPHIILPPKDQVGVKSAWHLFPS